MKVAKVSNGDSTIYFKADDYAIVEEFANADELAATFTVEVFEMDEAKFMAMDEYQG